MPSGSSDDKTRRDRAELLDAHWASEAKAARKRKLFVGAGAVAAVALVGSLVTVALVNDPPPPARQDIEVAGLETFEDLSREHVPDPVDYEQKPPVGGNHSSTWLNCGVYEEPVPDEHAVHSLEHGAVWAAYDPEVLTDEDVQSLQETLPDSHVVVSPYEGLDSPVVVSAWGAQVAVEAPDDERIEDFVAKYWQSPEAPEPGAACTGGIDGPGRVA